MAKDKGGGLDDDDHASGRVGSNLVRPSAKTKKSEPLSPPYSLLVLLMKRHLACLDGEALS
jgi:hypothetical protein